MWCTVWYSYRTLQRSSIIDEVYLKYVKIFMFNSGKARILIVGAGGLGLWGTQIASKVYPKNCIITVTDIAVSFDQFLLCISSYFFINRLLSN